MGRECQRCHGAPEVFHTYFGSRYNCKILAVGGELLFSAQDLRLNNAQILLALCRHFTLPIRIHKRVSHLSLPSHWQFQCMGSVIGMAAKCWAM